MIKAVGQTLVHVLRDQFPVFTQGDYARVFLWDEGRGYPDETGAMVSLELLPRPFCLVHVADNDAEAVTLGGDAATIRDRYGVRLHLFCRHPPVDPYEHETLPEQVKQYFAAHDVDFYDYDESPPALRATSGAEQVVVTRSEGRDIADALFRYRTTIRMRFVFYR